jgi:osmotically-inducible protein OsmY
LLSLEATMTPIRTLVCVALAAPLVGPLTAQFVEAGQTASQIEREVRDAVRRDGDARRLEISIQDSEVTLTGEVPTFWTKDEVIKRTLAIEGVETVVSEIEIPAVEDDNDIAQDVAKAVQRYPHYTIWDHIEGRINGGRVTLTGRVTPDRDKAGDIFERVAKVKGVQDVQSDIRALSPSRSDRELRQAIGYRVFSSEHFERFASMTNPPFHIVVDNGVVTLVGYVQSDIEMHELQRIVAQTMGILRVENQLQTVR